MAIIKGLEMLTIIVITGMKETLGWEWMRGDKTYSRGIIILPQVINRWVRYKGGG